MSGYHDTMQVCRKWGHKITDFYDSFSARRQNFCEKCGSDTVIACAHCNMKIRGFYRVVGVIGGKGPEVPWNCHQCGKPYPWRGRLLVKKIGRASLAPFKYIIDSAVSIFKKN